MNVLGIEIKGSDCICILLSGDKGSFTVTDFPRKLTLKDSYDSKAVKEFHRELQKLISSENVNFTAVKKRTEKGKFAGGALSFKMEGLIQLASEDQVSFFSGAELSSFVKNSSPAPENLSKYQHQAYFTALKCFTQKIY